MSCTQSRKPSLTRKWTATLAFGVGFVALAVSPSGAQDRQAQSQNIASARQPAEMDMAKPAPILVIYREDVKAGRVDQHDRLEANFARTYANMPGARYFLAMNSMSGPNQSWFMQPYSSLEEVQKESQASNQAPAAIRSALERITGGEPDNLTSQQAIVTLYREDLSHNANMEKLPHARYVEVTTYRVQAGHGNDFEEAAKMVRAAHDKANQPLPWVVYEVFAGAPGGTYYVFRALESLAEADPTVSENGAMMKAVNQALGDDGQKRLMQLIADGHMMREVNFFAFNPKTSYAPPAFAAADGFWSQPSQIAQVGTTGKTAKKPTMARAKREKKQ